MSNFSPQMLMDHTTEIVSSYVGNNPVSRDDLPKIIADTHAQLTSLVQDKPPRPEPAVPINQSVTEHHIVCLEDGTKLKMLKRYLRTRYDLTPEAYRKRWGLPADYPMVAPEYARRRSDFAKKIGLGRAAP